MIQSIANAFYWVSDMDRAVRFYRDVLGLKLVQQGPEWSSFDVTGVTLGLHLREHRATEADPDRPPQGAEVTFAVDDIRATHDALRNRGVVFLTPVIEQPWADLAKLADPDGNVLNLRQEKQSGRAPGAFRSNF